MTCLHLLFDYSVCFVFLVPVLALQSYKVVKNAHYLAVGNPTVLKVTNISEEHSGRKTLDGKHLMENI